MKIDAIVVGHKLVRKLVGGLTVTKVKIELEGANNLKVNMLVDEDDRVKYPFGSGAVVDFYVQQSMRLEK